MTRSATLKSSRTSGFTLIEVLLALALFGIIFGAIMQGFINTLQALSTLEESADRNPDVRFVRSQVIQIDDRDEMEGGGTIETLDLGPAEWQAEIEETDIADLFRLKLDITIRPPAPEEPVEYHETLYVLRPTWSDPVERSILLGDAKKDLENERLKYR